MKKTMFLLLTILTLSVTAQDYELGYKVWTKNGKQVCDTILTKQEFNSYLCKNNLTWVYDIPDFLTSAYSEVTTDSVYLYIETGTVWKKKSGKTAFRRCKERKV